MYLDHPLHQVYQRVQFTPKDLLCQDDRHLAPVQPHHPICRGTHIFFRTFGIQLDHFRDKVLLQTYIKYLRGLVEEKKTINHHGREVEVDLGLLSEKPSLTQVYDLK